ncbi:hypothetical protein HN358_01485 [Candidatus Uhrbacteria bacterium]|jgi:hypothetical protein|nr:hypothetical protein [Candidatus Uhrbacteria bacterium]MBT7717298.1 hypothetical protein [Candidatus Uhrbacteria bacterium]
MVLDGGTSSTDVDTTTVDTATPIVDIAPKAAQVEKTSLEQGKDLMQDLKLDLADAKREIASLSNITDQFNIGGGDVKMSLEQLSELAQNGTLADQFDIGHKDAILRLHNGSKGLRQRIGAATSDLSNVRRHSIDLGTIVTADSKLNMELNYGPLETEGQELELELERAKEMAAKVDTYIETEYKKLDAKDLEKAKANLYKELESVPTLSADDF